jgi:hypothetical protein
VINLHPRHFSLLRLAKRRGLYIAERLGPLYAIPSYSRKQDGLQWIVSLDKCSCPAVGYCSHLALAVDDYYRDEAGTREYLDYMNAAREDFKALELRVLHGETTADDRRYVRPRVEKVLARQETSEVGQPAGCSF